jgi:hypothetical protein
LAVYPANIPSCFWRFTLVGFFVAGLGFTSVGFLITGLGFAKFGLVWMDPRIVRGGEGKKTKTKERRKTGGGRPIRFGSLILTCCTRVGSIYNSKCTFANPENWGKGSSRRKLSTATWRGTNTGKGIKRREQKEGNIISPAGAWARSRHVCIKRPEAIDGALFSPLR